VCPLGCRVRPGCRQGKAPPALSGVARIHPPSPLGGEGRKYARAAAGTRVPRVGLRVGVRGNAPPGVVPACVVACEGAAALPPRRKLGSPGQPPGTRVLTSPDPRPAAARRRGRPDLRGNSRYLADGRGLSEMVESGVGSPTGSGLGPAAGRPQTQRHTHHEQPAGRREALFSTRVRFFLRPPGELGGSTLLLRGSGDGRLHGPTTYCRYYGIDPAKEKGGGGRAKGENRRGRGKPAEPAPLQPPAELTPAAS
jgi:hypothetical protein